MDAANTITIDETPSDFDSYFPINRNSFTLYFAEKRIEYATNAMLTAKVQVR